jgi:hypothetical protein
VIIKSSQRGSPRQLAYHLMSEKENEKVVFSGQRGLLSETILDSLDDMELISYASPRCEKHLYHISMNPSEEMDDEQWELAWELYEEEFALGELPYIEVTHTKPDGRLHKHRVYSRIDVDTGTAVQLSFTRIRNEKVARVLEYYFQHPLTVGKHNRAVMNHLKQEGYEEVLQWLEEGNASHEDRPAAATSPSEHQQQKRTKMPVEEVKHDLKTAYEQTDNGHAFEVAIVAKGYLMARGDRRDIVIVDEVGGVHSPRRRLGVKAKELRAKWSDITLEHLPTVEQVKEARDERRRIGNIRKHNPPDEALKKLREEEERVAQEIRDLERQCELERKAREETTDIAGHCLLPHVLEQLENTPSKTQEPMNNESGKDNPREQQRTPERSSQKEPFPEPKELQSQTPNERELIETFWNMTLDPERGRRSSREGSQQKNAPFQSAQKTTETILSLTGKDAEQERVRRIQRAEQEKPPESTPEKTQASAVGLYLNSLGSMMKEKGQGVYRYADRFLAERLARYGHSAARIRSVLLRASPELMNRDPGARTSYVWRLTERIHQREKKAREKKIQEAQKKKKESQKKEAESKKAKDKDKDKAKKKEKHQERIKSRTRLDRDSSKLSPEKPVRQQSPPSYQRTKSPEQKRFEKTTDEVMAVRSHSSPKPPGSGQKNEVGISWLNNEESARRVENMIDSHKAIKDKEVRELNAGEHYQRSFCNNTFLDEFTKEEYGSVKADQWIAKKMIRERLEEGHFSRKTSEQLGQDMLDIHHAIADKSPNAGRHKDQHGYAGKVFDGAWKEIFEQQQNEKQARQLSGTPSVDSTKVYQQKEELGQIQKHYREKQQQQQRLIQSQRDHGIER